MLFLPDSTYQRRRVLAKKFETGALRVEDAWRELLALDPDDYIALTTAGDISSRAGDSVAAEEYYWRAIRAHPAIPAGYLALSRFFNGNERTQSLANALARLAIAKGAVNDELLQKITSTAPMPGEIEQQLKQLEPLDRSRLIAAMLEEIEKDESSEVTEKMRPLRLLDQVQNEDMDDESVDLVIARGAEILPLLIGLLRDWAQELLVKEEESGAENALALLGEMGGTDEIRPILELANVDDTAVRSTAGWALRRIFERIPAEAARFVLASADDFNPAARLALSVAIAANRAVLPVEQLFEAVTADVEKWKADDLEVVFPVLLGVIAAGRSPYEIEKSRGLLDRAKLPRHTRQLCKALLKEISTESVREAPFHEQYSVYDICSGNASWEDDEDDDEDDVEDDEEEEDELPEQPVRRVATPGRNDPCWCGSGRKYKKCHLDADEMSRQGRRPEIVTRAGAKDFNGLRRRLGDLLAELLPGSRFDRAAGEFLEYETDAAEEQDLENIQIEVTDWLIHDRVFKSGRTLIEEFLRRHGSGLAPYERDILEAWANSYVGLYEVESIKPGEGAELKDLITGDTLFIHDVSMSKSLIQWDNIMIRVVPGERGNEVTGVALRIPPPHLAPLKEWMEEDRQRLGSSWPEYLKANWPKIRAEAHAIAREWIENLQLVNTDREQLIFSRAVYEIVNEENAADRIREAFAARAGFENDSEQDTGSFAWLNDEKTVLGHLKIGNGKVVVEANSRERLERARDLLQQIAGSMVRHVRDEFTTVNEIKRRAMELPSGRHSYSKPAESEALEEEKRKLLQQFLDDHYRKWPDRQLPALNGLTPRQAAGNTRMREKLIDLLKEFENDEERKRRAGDAWYDVSRLREELQLNQA